MSSLKTIQSEVRALRNPDIATHSQGFFKTGPGQYGEGDVFLGVRVPELRKIARRFKDIEERITYDLLQSKYHEERLTALLIMVLKFEKGDERQRNQIYDAYLSNTVKINNWDLVDVSADKIVGSFLENRDRTVLYKLANSRNLWEKRISIMSTFWFIRLNDFSDTLKVADLLRHDNHDLIHKAVGWMLREVGNRNRQVEEEFLKPRYSSMPRTMLRYAIEKFPEGLRQDYLKGRI